MFNSSTPKIYYYYHTTHIDEGNIDEIGTMGHDEAITTCVMEII